MAAGTREHIQIEPVLANVHWLFFDLDGTLADSITGLQASIRIAFQTAGKPFPSSDLRQWIGPGIRTILRNMEPSLSDTDLDTMEHSFRGHYDREGILRTEMFRGVPAVLHTLKQNGCRLFVVTNKPKLATGTLLQAKGLTDLFDEIVSRNSSEPAYASKGEMLKETACRHHADPSRSVMIGDTEEDAEAAAHAGMRFVHAAYGYGTCTKPAHARLENFHDLVNLCGLPHKHAVTPENGTQ